MSEDFFLFAFFWIGFMVFRSGAFQSRFCSSRKKGHDGSLSFSRLSEDFKARRYEQVLEGWAQLEEHTIDALSLVVSSLLCLGRPEDIGVFVAKTSESLPHLKAELHQVISAVSAPVCEVRRQHIMCGLRELFEHRAALDTVAAEELLCGLAKVNEEANVATMLSELADRDPSAEPAVLEKVVKSFLACQNVDAALRYLRKVLVEPSDMEAELILAVVKVSTEAEISDDDVNASPRPKAWDVLDALEGVQIPTEAALLMLEWSLRQTPVDVSMACRIEKRLRKSGGLPIEAFDALIRVHASSTGDETKAFACFDELVEIASKDEIAETSLVGMISSCVEARKSNLAEHILSWTCQQDRCTSPVFSATMKVLAASKDADRIVTLYEKTTSKQDLILDESLTTLIANCASQTGHSDLARKLTKVAVKHEGKSQLSMMRACAAEGDADKVLALLAELKDQDEIETVTYNCALDACVSAGNAEAVKTVMKEMKASRHLDVASYNILLKQCASTRAGREVLNDMQRQGFEPNTATYNSLLSCAMTTGDFAGVWDVIEDLEKSGQPADIYTLSILFKGYRRERRTLDADSMNKALQLIKRHSVKLDETLANVILEACLLLRDVRVIRRTLDTFWDSGWNIPKQASLHTYGVLIKAYGQIQGLTEAWQLWTEVTEEKRMEPSEQIYGQMLDVLVSNNSLDDALSLFEDMKKNHSANISSQGFSVAYAMIIRGFAQQKDLAKALSCYEEMKSHGTKASLVVFNTLIDACSRVGDMDAASKLFKDMEDSQCTPDLITYSTLIKGYCFNNDLEEALQLFGLMQDKGIRPDAIVFNSVLDGCAKKQVPALCEQVISDMVAAGVMPSNHSASILIKLYGRCKDLDAAFKVINEMPRKYGFRPNNAVYTCLMSACIANNALDRAMDLHKRMLADGVYPDDRTYSTLLRGTLRACSVEQCTYLVNAALDTGSRARNLLEDDLVRSVLILTQRHNAWDTVGRDLQDRLRSSGIVVRLPLPPDNCSRNDGFGRSQRENNDGKRGFGNGFPDRSSEKEGRYHHQQYNHHQQHRQQTYQQQRRH